MSEVNPRIVKCSNCNSQPGSPCTQPTDTGRVRVNWFHYARINEARLYSECELYQGLDMKYRTPKDSSLHHDNRCPIHSDKKVGVPSE